MTATRWLHPSGHRRAARVPGLQLPRLVRGDAPVIVGNPDRPSWALSSRQLLSDGPEIAASSRRRPSSPTTARTWDGSRSTTLVLQCSDDVIAPASVGAYVADAVPDGTLVRLEATGHCPTSGAEETIAAIRTLLRRRKAA